jgi:hypothetical protein
MNTTPRKTGYALITAIAHELRHTIEAIGEPSVRTDADKYFFYERCRRQRGAVR